LKKILRLAENGCGNVFGGGGDANPIGGRRGGSVGRAGLVILRRRKTGRDLDHSGREKTGSYSVEGGDQGRKQGEKPLEGETSKLSRLELQTEGEEVSSYHLMHLLQKKKKDSGNKRASREQ